MINVGIIGHGKMGRIRMDAINRDHLARVVAVADPSSRPECPGVRTYREARDLVRDPEVAAVFVCTPNHLNKELTIESLRAGKHVFCEKPPAFTAADVAEIIEVESASEGCRLMYGLNHRHHESMKKAKELIDSGTYGRILWMRGRYGKSVDEDFYHTWRAKKETAGGGILIDQGIHMLDLFLMMAGDFDDAHAFVSNLYWNLDVEDNVFAIFRNSKGVVASLHSTMTQWRHLFSLEVFLENGSIIINGLKTPSDSYGAESMTITKNRTAAPSAVWSDEEHLTFETDRSWQSEVACFFQAIHDNTPITHCGSEDAIKLMRLVDRIYENQ